MEKTIRWGFLGCGQIAGWLCTAAKELPGCEIHAVASRSLEKAQRFAAEYGAKKAYGSYEELVSDPEVDVVHIATPHPMHLKDAMLAISHKKHVLCEKPITMDAKQAKLLLEAAKENGVFLMEAVWSYFLPCLNRVKALIEAGEIGQVRQVIAGFCTAVPFSSESRLYNLALGGGALLDVGVYPIYLTDLLLGLSPSQVTASAKIGPTGCDENCSFTLRYQNGAFAQLSCGIDADTNISAVIYGTRGRVDIPQFWKAQHATVTYPDGTGQEIAAPFLANGYEYEIMHVNACLREGKLQSEVASHEKTLAVMQLLDQIRTQIGLVYPQEEL